MVATIAIIAFVLAGIAVMICAAAANGDLGGELDDPVEEKKDDETDRRG